MRVVVKVRHTEVTDEIKEYARKKVLDKCATYLDMSDDSIVCDIELDDQFGAKGGKDKRIDLVLALPHQHLPIRVEYSDISFDTAINEAVDRLTAPLERYKHNKK